MTRKITSYALVREWNIGEFESKIKKAIKDGWEPHGSITITPNPHHDPESDFKMSYSPQMWVQAMVKYDDNTPSVKVHHRSP